MLPFYNNCVNWDRKDVDSLSQMIQDEVQITRRTFLKHVDREQMKELEADLGYEDHYSKGLTMARDWCVGYYKSKLHGKIVYFFRYSAIEYVFADTRKAG